MAISKKDNLFNLIKSLTKNEKKLFRESLKKSTEPKLYLQLFNKLESQSKHQKSEIKQAFDNKANQIPVIKIYLQRIILKFLKNYHQEQTSQSKLFNNFLEIEILLSRELFDLAEFEIEKTLQLARDSELLTPLLQAIEFKKQFLIKKFGASSDLTKKTITELIQEQNSLLEKIYNLHQYQEIQATFYDHFQQTSGLSSNIYTTLTKNPLLTSDKSPLSTQAHLLKAELLYNLHIYKDKNWFEAEEAIKKGIRHLELNPSTIKEFPESYLHLLNQLLELKIHSRQLQDITPLLQKIRNSSKNYHFESRLPSLKHHLLEAYKLELQIYQAQNNYPAALELIQEIEKEYQTLESPYLKEWKVLLDQEIAKTHLQNNQLHAAQEKFQQVIDSPHARRELDTLFSAYFLSCLTYLKQKNLLGLRSLLKKLEADLKSHKKPDKVEKQILKLFHLLPTHLHIARRHPQLIKQIETIKLASEKSSHNHQDLLEWLENTFMLELEQHK